jgi:hypothetical protein
MDKVLQNFIREVISDRGVQYIEQLNPCFLCLAIHLLGAAKRSARDCHLEMERNGSDSSDDGRGEGSARTPQGGNRRRHVSPDGTNAPASNSNQNLSREERKIQVSSFEFFAMSLLTKFGPLQAIMQSFAKIEERSQKKRSEMEEEEKGRTPAAPQPGERDDNKNRGTSPIRKRPKGESGMRRRQQQNSMMDSLDDIPPLHAIPHLSTHDRLRISKSSVALPTRAKSTSLPLKKRLMLEWAERENSAGSAARTKDSEKKQEVQSNAIGSDSSSDDGGMQVSPGPNPRMDSSRETWRDDWRRDDDRRNSNTQQPSSRGGGRDWGRERASTILTFEERQKLLADDAPRPKVFPPPSVRTNDQGATYDSQHSYNSSGSGNRVGAYGNGVVAQDRPNPGAGAGSNRPPWGPSYNNSGSGSGGGYDRPDQTYSGAPVSRMWERPPANASTSSPAVPAYPVAGGSNLLWNPSLMTFQPRPGFPSPAGGNPPARDLDTKDYRSSNPAGGAGAAGVVPPKVMINSVGVGAAPPKVIPRDPPPTGDMGYRFAPPPPTAASMYLGKEQHGQQAAATAAHIQRPPPTLNQGPPQQPGRGDADYRRVSHFL